MENTPKKKELAIKQFLVYVMSAKTVHITDIITQVRAIKGVVTISIFESSRSITPDKHFTKLKLKFLQYSESTEENIKQLKKDILMVDGVLNIILKIRKTDLEVKGGGSQPTAIRGTGGAPVTKVSDKPKEEVNSDGIDKKE